MLIEISAVLAAASAGLSIGILHAIRIRKTMQAYTDHTGQALEDLHETVNAIYRELNRLQGTVSADGSGEDTEQETMIVTRVFAEPEVSPKKVSPSPLPEESTEAEADALLEEVSRALEAATAAWLKRVQKRTAIRQRRQIQQRLAAAAAALPVEDVIPGETPIAAPAAPAVRAKRRPIPAPLLLQQFRSADWSRRLAAFGEHQWGMLNDVPSRVAAFRTVSLTPWNLRGRLRRQPAES